MKEKERGMAHKNDFYMKGKRSMKDRRNRIRQNKADSERRRVQDRCLLLRQHRNRGKDAKRG